MPTSSSATYQGRLTLTAEPEAFLSDYADRYNRIERKLYAEMRRDDMAAASFKNGYLVRFGITARQFNAIARNLEGKITSVLELLPMRKQETEQRIAKARKVLGKIKSPFKKHQKQRRLHALADRLAAIEAQLAAGDPRICFGSRKLFRQQFDLEANGFASHEEWLTAWREQRSSQFYVLGSKDETAGCQGCVVTANLDGTFNLRLRSLSKEAAYCDLRDVRIPYGQDELREALRQPQAISYRFLRDAKGWRVFVTTNRPLVAVRSIKAAGAIGVDLNADCLAVSEINRHGNIIGSRVVSLVTYGKTTEQAKALIGEAIKEIVDQAVTAAKPIVIEKLDFSKKKATLEAEDPRHARMLSSLTYNGIIQSLKSRADRFGIEVIDVNPAYSSIIGLVNYAAQCGISVHQAAAVVLARRGCGYRERPYRAEAATVATAKGDQVTFRLPERNRRKHVWSFWAAVKKNHTAVLAAHFRPLKREPGRRSPVQSRCPEFSVRPRDASRRQHCSGGAMDLFPW
jgi:IS605 OrfB family transposase